jgi:hypothetical protein
MKDQSTARLFAITTLAVCLQIGCGDDPSAPQTEMEPVCTEDEQAQPAEDCEISGHYQIEEPEDLRPFCESSCSNGEGLWIQVQGPVACLKPLSRLERILQLDIGEDSGLESLEGLENLEWAKLIYIEDTKRLRSLEGLGSLRTVEREMQVLHNEALTSTAGANALEETQNLAVNGNPNLTTLEFDSLERLGGLSVQFNESLAQCQADALADQIEDLGRYDTGDNADGSCE